MLLRYHLCEQNLFSELLAAVVVPLAVSLDLLFSALGFGVNTLTTGLDSSEQILLIQMYGVILSVELVTHAIVKFLLQRQLTAFRGVVRVVQAEKLHRTAQQQQQYRQLQQHNNNNNNNRNNHTSDGRARRMSIITVTPVEWSASSHNRKYWSTNFSYFMSLVAFSVTNVLFFTSQLKARLSKE